MKLSTIAASASLVLFPILAIAHGGGVNSYGCHNQSSTSTHHCHSGGGLHFDETDELITAENIHLLKHVNDDRSKQHHDPNHHHDESHERNESVLRPHSLRLHSPQSHVDAG